MEEYIEGSTIPYSIDLAALGTMTSLEIKFYKGQIKDTKAKFKYPTTTGWLTITKEGTVYSFEIPSTVTTEGVYGIELTAVINGKITRAQTAIGAINIKAT
jgi:hypothetical protein